MSENESTPVPDVLYHYCSAIAFFGIMASKRLWLSDAMSMNDYTEHKGFYDRATKRLEELAHDGCPNIGALVRALPRNISPYIFCLSSRGDLLSQWRSYSDDGTGFAIGFSGTGLRECVRVCKEEEVNEIALGEVLYSENEKEDLLRDLIQDYQEEAGQLRPDDRDWIAMAKGIALWNKAAICKNHRFHEEAEWRIVSMPVTEAETDGGISSMSFRVNEHRIIPYFTLPFQQNLVGTIYLGPRNCARGENKKHLEMFLLSHGYSGVKIEESAATYR